MSTPPAEPYRDGETPGRSAMGVIIVTYNSAEVIEACLRSLFASQDVDLHIVVVDNASGDDTGERVRTIAAERPAGTGWFDESRTAGRGLALVRGVRNGGYAYGVNLGLRALMPVAGIDLFWILNPDCEVEPDTAARLARAGADGQFSLMGGRTVYLETPDIIQSDGGTVSRWTGVCHPLNLFASAARTPVPAADKIDFISGASCVASRRFLEQAGMMEEDYFLYYEEVDWAFRRGSLPLRIADVTVRHRGGTAIGSGGADRRPSPFALYVNTRSRIRFVRRFLPGRLPLTALHAMLKALAMALKGAQPEAEALLRAAMGVSPRRSLVARLPRELGGTQD